MRAWYSAGDSRNDANPARDDGANAGAVIGRPRVRGRGGPGADEWQSCPVTETTAAPDPIDELVGEWLDWSECAASLGVSVAKVRQLIREHIGHVRGIWAAGTE